MTPAQFWSQLRPLLRFSKNPFFQNCCKKPHNCLGPLSTTHYATQYRQYATQHQHISVRPRGELWIKPFTTMKFAQIISKSDPPKILSPQTFTAPTAIYRHVAEFPHTLLTTQRVVVIRAFFSACCPKQPNTAKPHVLSENASGTRTPRRWELYIRT